MLAAIGFLIIAVILVLLLTQRVNAIVALAGVPFVGALIAGFSLADVSEFAMTGISGVVGVIAMFVFAIIYFGIVSDAGMFDPDRKSTRLNSSHWLQSRMPSSA